MRKDRGRRSPEFRCELGNWRLCGVWPIIEMRNHLPFARRDLIRANFIYGATPQQRLLIAYSCGEFLLIFTFCPALRETFGDGSHEACLTHSRLAHILQSGGFWPAGEEAKNASQASYTFNIQLLFPLFLLGDSKRGQ